MDRWKGEQGRVREKRKIRREKSRRERVRRKKMQMREKVGKSRNTVFFQWFVAPEGRKVGSLKRQVRSQLPDERWKIARRCGAKHISKSNVQNTRGADHFWQLRCRKSARRCGAKHISKWKCTKHTSFGPLLEVWDVEKVHAVVARSTFRSEHVQNTRGADHFWQLRCRKSWRRCGAKHISKSKCTKHHMFAPLLEVQMSFRVAGARDCAPCQKWPKRDGFVAFSTTTSTTAHYTPIHYIHYNYNYTFITFYYTTLHYTTLHSITLNYTTLHYTTLHYTTLRYTTLHYTTLPSTTLHYITLHYTPQHYNYNYTTTQLHSTTLNYTPLH